MKRIELSQAGAVGDIIRRLDKDWALLTAGTTEKANTMTVSWGGVGVLWHKPMVTIYVRPERYTYEFVEGEAYFSLAFFAPEYRDSLVFCGKESGRDYDKIAECGFTLTEGIEGGVYFAEADLVLICKKRYRTPITFEQMIDTDPSPYYGGSHGNLHVMYMGEIVEIYTKES